MQGGAVTLARRARARDDRPDLHYGFINFISALRADVLCFNSAYHCPACSNTFLTITSCGP